MQLPAGYDPASPRTYPVIVAMHGLPVSPDSYGKLDHFYARLDAAVAEGRIAAPIVVVPQLNRTPDDDSECIDDPHGLQTESWLAADLPRWVERSFPVARDRGSWATWGYSLGGWSATMLAMKHHETFGAAVSYQGYLRPQFDGASPLPTGSAQARAYDLIELEKTHPVPVCLWLFASNADRVSYPLRPGVPARRRGADERHGPYRTWGRAPAVGVDAQDPTFLRLAGSGAAWFRAIWPAASSGRDALRQEALRRDAERAHGGAAPVAPQA